MGGTIESNCKGKEMKKIFLLQSVSVTIHPHAIHGTVHFLHVRSILVVDPPGSVVHATITVEKLVSHFKGAL